MSTGDQNKNNNNHHPEVVVIGRNTKDLLPDGGAEMFSKNAEGEDKPLPVFDDKGDLTQPVTPAPGADGASDDKSTVTDPPAGGAAPQSFNEVINELKLQDQIKTPEDLAKAYKELQSKFTKTSQENSIIKQAMGNPAIQQAQPSQSFYPPGYGPQPPPQQQQYFATPPPAAAPKAMSAVELESLNENFLDNPITSMNKFMTAFMANSGLMTQSDYAKIEQAKQFAAQQQRQTEDRIVGVISTLPDYEKYQSVMSTIYESNQYYKSIPPEQGIPILYNAAKLIVDGGSAPANPAIETQMDKTLAQTHSGGNAGGSSAGGGSDLDNIDWGSMTPEQIEKVIGNKARF